MFKKPLKKIPSLLQKMNFKIALKSYPNYQPVFYNGTLITEGNRDCADRWEIIKKVVEKYKGTSLLDIGCAEGFYVLHAAKELGCVSVGIDSDVRRLFIGYSQLLMENIQSAGFILGTTDVKMLGKIPTFDIVILMSVVHHMMYTSGIDFCRNFLIELRKKIGKAMIFEMGQSNENKNDWANKLPDMGKSPHDWIKNFLLSSGFSKVTKIGESDSYQKDQNRAIFLVEP